MITGGNSGIGKAKAIRFAREGAMVITAALRVEEDEQTLKYEFVNHWMSISWPKGFMFSKISHLASAYLPLLCVLHADDDSANKNQPQWQG